MWDRVEMWWRNAGVQGLVGWLVAGFTTGFEIWDAERRGLLWSAGFHMKGGQRAYLCSEIRRWHKRQRGCCFFSFSAAAFMPYCPHQIVNIPSHMSNSSARSGISDIYSLLILSSCQTPEDRREDKNVAQVPALRQMCSWSLRGRYRGRSFPSGLSATMLSDRKALGSQVLW